MNINIKSIVLFCSFILLLSTSHAFAKKKKKTLQGLINLNTATQEQLMLLPRIGPKKAKRILRYRRKNRFRYPSQILRVKGIGKKTFARFSRWLTTKKPTNIRVIRK